MRLLKFFSLVAMFTVLATYVKADQAPEMETAPDLQQEEMAFNQEPISYHSAADERADTEEAVPSYDQGYGLKEDQMMSAYNSPARIDVKGAWDVFVTASYIYWQPKEKGLEYGFTIPADAAVLAPVDYTYRVHDLSYDYKSGFKVALGTNLDHDDWIAMIEYIRLNSTQTGSATQSTTTYSSTAERLWSPWIYASNLEAAATPFTKLTGKWKLKYNMFNLEFARPCYVGTKLTFKPHMGLTGGWINQKYKSVGTILTNTFTIPARAKSNSWMIGPRAGVDGHWILGAGFDVEADVAGALAYQKIKGNFKQTSEYWTTAYKYKGSKTIGQITPVLEGTIGLGWGTYFDCNKWHFSLQALYDVLYYFDQNYMRKLTDQIMGNAVGLVRINSSLEDLMLQGLTITARLDF